jgi:glycosyltransferase involved in cell wall biosynthesis
MVKIAVVLSVYNGATYLSETIESLLNQTETDFEVIAVNDGSTDTTAEILDRYAQRDRRVRVIHQENHGLTRSLIIGCSLTNAELIARHDAGDVSHPTRLAVQSLMFDHSPELNFVSCATQYVGPGLEPLWVAPAKSALIPMPVLSGVELIDGPTHHGSVMFRRAAYERVGGYRAEFRYGQDFDLWYRLAQDGKFQTTPQVLYTARILPGGISSAARRQQETLARLSRGALEARLRGESDSEIVARAARVGAVRHAGTRRSRAAGLYFIGEALRKRRNPRSRDYLWQAVAEWPFFLRAWIRLAQALIL